MTETPLYPAVLTDTLRLVDGLHLGELDEDLSDLIVLGHHAPDHVRAALAAAGVEGEIRARDLQRRHALVVGPCRADGDGDVIWELTVVPAGTAGSFPCTFLFT